MAMGLDLIPATLHAKYKFEERDHTCAILARDFPDEFKDIRSTVTKQLAKSAGKVNRLFASVLRTRRPHSFSSCGILTDENGCCQVGCPLVISPTTGISRPHLPP